MLAAGRDGLNGRIGDFGGDGGVGRVVDSI